MIHMNRSFTAIVLLLGVVLAVVAVVYWLTPAGALPHYFPGFVEGAAQKHIKHGLVAFIVALGLFAYAWFETGKR
jgi:hypothetical protein